MHLSAYDWKRIAIPIEADGLHSQYKVYTSTAGQNDSKAIECDAWDRVPESAHTSVAASET